MGTPFRKFFLKNLYFSLVLAIIGIVVFKYFLSNYYHHLYPLLLIIAFAANLLSFYYAIKSQNTGTQIMNAILKSFGIRFILYLGIAIVYLIFVDDTKQRIAFILTLFFIYTIYSVLEITSLLKHIKEKT